MTFFRDLLNLYGPMVWRRRWWGLAFAWLVCLAGWAAVWLMPSQYQATARLYVDADQVLTPLLKGLAIDPNTGNELDVLQRSLLSRPNLEKIIARTELAPLAETPEARQRLIDRLAAEIRVQPQTRDIFSITWRNRDPRTAHDVVQAVLDTFLDNRTGSSRSEMSNAESFLATQIDSYQKQLHEAEERRAAFQRKYVDVLPGAGGRNRLEEARQSETALTGQLADAEARRLTLARELATTPALIVTDQGVVGGGPAPGLADAERRLRELRLTYTDQHPDVIAAQRLVDSLRHAGGGGGRAVSRSQPNPVYDQLKIQLVETETQVNSLTRQVADARATRERLETVARAEPQLEAESTNLNRDYDVLRRNYEELLARREAMRIASAATEASKVKVQVIDPPVVPRVPVAPNRALLSAGVLVVALGCGAALIYALIAFERSFRTVSELRALDLPVLGGVSLVAQPMGWMRRLASGFATGGCVAALLAAAAIVLTHYLHRVA
jgi:polysaccharide chain length determinant protein (PEP-CTERM system associated)